MLFLFGLLFIPLSEAGLKEQVFETILPNGLKVILLENHKAPLVTFQVWYRVGSRNEPWGKTGISHVLEHMMFKGTRQIGPEEFSRIVQENGGNDNAFTSRDYTAYFQNLSSDRIQVSLDLESDRMQNLLLREEDFRTERMVVMEERRLRTEDNPTGVLLEQLQASAFQVHPYRWPIIGWMGDLKRLTLDDLKEYYTTYYNPSNAFLVVAGDFKKEELLPRIEKAFGSYSKGVAPNQEKDKEPFQMGERRILVKKEAQLPTILMAYHVPNLHDPDSYVLEVIATLLSGGKSSRLYQNLVREKRLVLRAEADYSLLSYDPYLFYLSAEPLPNKETAEVEKALDQEIEWLQKELVPERELEKVKNQMEASFVFGQDSIFYQAMVLAQHEIAFGWRAIDDYLPSIRKVTPEDIQRVAKKYLISDNRTVGILIPLPPKEGKPSPEGSPIKEKMVR
ncbi:MAG: peptidase M16 [Deltaproteobacteria bacterium RBG_19FT_COMBO_46_12]|nr:MAG: peptidase M16 [Deltaproteobacteria bacterium RBG_19FT_COMBO_46_12]